MSTTLQTHLQRIVHYRFGDPREVLRIEDAPLQAALAPGHVRVRILRSVIHPGDLQLIAAKFSDAKTDIPQGRVPGSEAVGTVQEAAPGALDGTGLTQGSRVAFLAQGAWQSIIDLPARSLVAVPENVSDETATQLLVNTVTARHVLRAGLNILKRRPPNIVLTGAASAVGKIITILAMRDDLHVVRIVRSHDSASRLTQILPGGEIIDTASNGWQEAVRRAGGWDLPLVIDGVGGHMVAEIGRMLNVGGAMVSFGLLDGGPADLSMFLPKSLTLRGATIGTWQNDTTPEERSQDIATAIDIAATNPSVFDGFRTFELSELNAAIAAVTAPAKSGNIVIKF
jgi:NADPH:quinone reductase-like Zn-dependent oxidoreductase